MEMKVLNQSFVSVNSPEVQRSPVFVFPLGGQVAGAMPRDPAELQPAGRQGRSAVTPG